MQLQLQDFPTLLRNQAAAVAASCRTLIDVSVGSVLRAILEANASVALWMQWLIMEVLATTRAATSAGADLDSWVGDFGLTRLPAIAATGMARFSRATPGLAAVVPAGAIVRTGTGPGAQAFAVSTDASRADWNGVGYVLPPSATDVNVPVRATVPGRAGNVQAGVLVLLSTAIPGVDAVMNDYPASGGLDAEIDAALRFRFGGYIDSRTRATAQAVTFAIQSVQQGLQFFIADGFDSAEAARPGYFTVVVDDGSGAPSDALLAQVGEAIEAVRPLGASYCVIRPRLVVVNVTMQVSGPAAPVQSAVGAWIAGLPMGGSVIVSKLIQVAHESNPAVTRVANVTINGGTDDLSVGAYARPVPGIVMVLS